MRHISRLLANLLRRIRLYFADPAAPARVTIVIDGDTFDVVDTDGARHRVRIAGIDAPERDQPMGLQAKRFLANAIAHREVLLTRFDTDHFGRVVCSVSLRGEDVGLMMIRNGLAWHYRRFTPHWSAYAAAQTRAEKSGIGLWGKPGLVEPWRFRGIQA